MAGHVSPAVRLRVTTPVGADTGVTNRWPRDGWELLPAILEWRASRHQSPIGRRRRGEKRATANMRTGNGESGVKIRRLIAPGVPKCLEKGLPGERQKS